MGKKEYTYIPLFRGGGVKYFTAGETNKSCAEYTPLQIKDDKTNVE